MPQKTVTLVNPKVNDKWYNIRRFMGEKTQENLIIGICGCIPHGARALSFLTTEYTEYTEMFG